jgi:hypothetical protein
MIDLETLGLTANSVVLSIGAALFDIESKDIGPTFYSNIDRESCVGLEMEIDVGTVDWWSRQSEQARASLYDPAPLPAVVVSREFCIWIKKNSDERELRVWSHGATFDIPLVRTLARKTQVTLPWNYWNEYDTRTLVFVTRKRAKDAQAVAKLDRTIPGIPHHALSDAIAQAQWMQNIWETLNG